MTYQSFHQKYRPQIFAELVGQDAISQTLTPAIAQSRIALVQRHSLILG